MSPSYVNLVKLKKNILLLIHILSIADINCVVDSSNVKRLSSLYRKVEAFKIGEFALNRTLKYSFLQVRNVRFWKSHIPEMWGFQSLTFQKCEFYLVHISELRRLEVCNFLLFKVDINYPSINHSKIHNSCYLTFMLSLFTSRDAFLWLDRSHTADPQEELCSYI